MFERSDLDKLAAFEGTAPVVSLYLNLPPRLRGTPEAYRARLRGLLKEAAGQAQAEDIQAIEEYFEREFDWMGRSVAVFCGQGDGLWRVEQFAVPIRSTIYIGEKLLLMPLANLMDTYGAYSVALIDQQCIRLFHFHLGEIVEAIEAEGEDIKRVKSGGGAAGRSRGRGEDVSGATSETVRSNLRDSAEALAAFCGKHDAEHVLLGGADPTVQQFKELLASPWRERIEGAFSIAMRAPETEVMERSLEVMTERLQAYERELVHRVHTLAAAGGNAIIGLEETLAAIEQGRVQTLVIVEGAVDLEQAGLAVTRALDYGAEVEFVGEDGPLTLADGIGALLRY